MRSARSNERGAGLIEILVAITILGITSAALLGGVITVARTSAMHSDQAKAEAILTSAAEALRGADNYVECAEPSNYADTFDLIDVPSGWTITIPAPIADWNGSEFIDDAASPPGFCENDLLRLQLVTLEVRSASDVLLESVSVVKDDG